MLSHLNYPNINPEMLPHVKWYGVAYATGFLCGYFVLRRLSRRGTLRISVDQLDDLVFWLVLGVLLGGRLGWWIVYHGIGYEPGEPWYAPLAIWHGGMSFHGGLAGVMLVLIVWCRRQRVSTWHVMDYAALVTPMGLFFGRIANFINGELYGRVTDVPWAMIFPRDPSQLPRHPSQLYEALCEGPVLLALLWLSRKLLTPRDGRIASLFLAFYGALRFGIEFTREPDKGLGPKGDGYIAWGWLTTGQLLCALIVAIGIAMYVWCGRNSPPIPAVATPPARKAKRDR